VCAQSMACRSPPAWAPPGRPACAAAMPLVIWRGETTPMTWLTMLPSGLTKNVSGRPVTPQPCAVSFPASRRWGKLSENSRMKPRAASRASCWFTPSTRTSRSDCLHACSRTGASSRQGGHHDAQKLITRVVPRSSLNDTRRSRAARHQVGEALPRSPAVSTSSTKRGAGVARPSASASSIVLSGACVVRPYARSATTAVARTTTAMVGRQAAKLLRSVGKRRHMSYPG